MTKENVINAIGFTDAPARHLCKKSNEIKKKN
jgi:hypothetical protein